jgi:thymidylate synthase (FAD)
MDRVDVLDHGFVRLVDHMGSDLSIVRAARVSYDAAWRAGTDAGSDERLLRRLWKDHHTSPFEAVEFQFEVYAPIFVFRQWHRHRTWSFNELSGRYRELPEVVYVPDPLKVGIQSLANKQGRDFAGQYDRGADVDLVRKHAAAAFELYRHLLALEWPRELARSVLPVSTYSHMFAKVDLRNLLHFLDLRTHEHAQYEIRVYADAIVSLIEAVVPVTVAAWREARSPS